MRALAAALLLGTGALAAAPKTVAVAYFDNDSTDRSLDPLRKGLADLLIVDLVNAKSVVVVEREKLQAVVEELELGRSRLADKATALKVGKLLAAHFILTGAYQVAGGTMRVDARLIEVATGAVAATTRVEAKTEEFYALEKDLVEAVVKALKLPLTVAERQALRESQTESLDAFERYSRGLEALDQKEPEKARQQFEAALAADPSYQRAQTANARLGALTTRAMAQQDDLAKRRLAELKPNDPLLDGKLFALINDSQLTTDQAHIELRAAVLRYIFERKLKPSLESRDPSGPFYFEALNLVFLTDNYVDDPEIAPRLPAMREYLRAKYPGIKTVEQLANQPLPSAQDVRADGERHAKYVAARAEVERLTRDIAAQKR